MKISILSAFNAIPYFTLTAVKQLMWDNSLAPGVIQNTMSRWMKAGHVIQLKRGVYMTRRFFELHSRDADFSPAVSAILIPQSYVSLEFVLQRNAILTEMTYPVTAVTLKQTRVIENSLGTFTYRNIKDNLYHGFSIIDYLGVPFAMASPAKALFDFLYLRPWHRNNRYAGYNLAEDLRLNLEDFSKDNQMEFAGMVEASRSRKMEQILKNLRRTAWQP